MDHFICLIDVLLSMSFYANWYTSTVIQQVALMPHSSRASEADL